MYNCITFAPTMFSFNKKYFLLFLILFLLEVSIALFVRDRFIRPYLGDFLVVMLLYCFLKSVFRISTAWAALLVLTISFLVEFLQYLQITKVLGLERKAVATTILGTQFDWHDMLAYTAGVGIILLIEKWREFGSGQKV